MGFIYEYEDNEMRSTNRDENSWTEPRAMNGLIDTINDRNNRQWRCCSEETNARCDVALPGSNLL